jgi:transcriptional regulator with XRE-family HTH domain
MYIHQNLKFLRLRKGMTQAEMALKTGLSRSQIAGYEVSIKPTLEALILLSDFFGTSADALLKLDFTSVTELRIRELEEGNAQRAEEYVRGKKLRILATTTDPSGKELTEWVPDKAKAGYLNGFSDPDYISELPRTHFPFLSSQKKHRVFQLDGDSMPPHAPGSYVVCSYIEDWTSLKNGGKYIILTTTEGIVFKLVYNQLEGEESLLLCSTNPIYQPFQVRAEDIREVWKYEWSIGE